MEIKGLVVYLGAPNDEKGKLSDISISRAEKTIQEYLAHENYKILCTGGFGDHFNTTEIAHGLYVRNFLIGKGVPDTNILEDVVLSNNTEEDALLLKPKVEEYGVTNLIVVSSDFHMKRVRGIFEKIFVGYDLTFSEAETNLPEEEMKTLREHEERCLEELVEKGYSCLE